MNSKLRLAVLLLGMGIASAPAHALAQSVGASAEAWGQTHPQAGLLNLEGRARTYPWLRAEAQVWVGGSALPERNSGDVVVLAAQLTEPGGRARLRAGRFVLATGAVRPVHLDGGHVALRAPAGTGLEVFGGVPVVPSFAARGYDWLVGTRLSQRVAGWGALGASYLQRRDRGQEVDEEVGVDFVAFPLRHVDVSGRGSYDLSTGGLSEVQGSLSLGGSERRAEVFGSLRNAALILPATSLFSVLSNTPSLQAGIDGRWLLAPRLRVQGLGAYRGLDDRHGVRASLGATLWLDAERQGSLEGQLTRDGLPGDQWWGARARLARDLLADLRLLAELEVVRPDDPRGRGRVWPWARLTARYRFLEDWQFSAGVEGSASPQFTQLWRGLLRVAYQRGAT